MMDKKNYDMNEEEYKIQEPDTGTAHFSSESSSIFERINRQTIVAGFVFIFLIFGTYKLLSKVFYSIKKQPVAETIKPVAKTDSSPKDLVVTAVDSTTNRLDHLAQQQSDVQSSIQSLDTEIANIQTLLTNLTTQVAQVSDEVRNLGVSQEKFIQSQTQPVKKEAAKKEAPKAIYYVRAVIPGRVWLTTPEGTTLTLGVGDKLVGYGLVASINVEQGIVTFSSGAVIGYSPNDR